MAPSLVLPVESAPTSEAQTFGSVIPGEFVPGQPVELESIGVTVEEARAIMETHPGLPLEESGDWPKPPEGRTVAELKAELEALGLSTSGKKDELVERLEQAHDAAAVEAQGTEADVVEPGEDES